MADAPPSGGQSFGARMSRKVGPLPVWAWAVIALVIGYFLYKRFGSGGSSAPTGTTPATVTDTTPIPVGDQSGGGVGSASGSSGTQTPVGGVDKSGDVASSTFAVRRSEGPNTSSGFHEQIGGFQAGSGQGTSSGGFRAV